VLTGFSIITTPDGLKAYLQIQPKTMVFPSEKEILNELHDRGVVFGLDNLTIREIASGKKNPGMIEIAKGVVPLPGVNGRIEILVDILSVGKPKELDDGRVDHHEICSVINVKSNVPLARRIPPAAGIEGKSVFGKSIPPPIPEDVILKAGIGTCISADDPNLLVSSIEGAVSVDKSGSVDVKRQRVIDNDIDYSTGNISFAGDLIIRGTVRAGFTVDVQGNLRVCGNVEDTRIKSGGWIEIDGGAVGAGTGLIECLKHVKVRHLENFSIRSGNDVIIHEDSLHSSIVSEGKIRAKSIIGGSVNAFGVECESIGSTAETRTVLDIGRMHQLIEERRELMRKSTELREYIQRTKNEQFTLVRTCMDENGLLNEEDINKLEVIKNKTVESIKTHDRIRQRIDCINDKEKTLGSCCGIIAETIYPNTFIKFGNGERHVQDLLKHVKLFAGSQGN
jgi:uncharacterized protein (DUF342 family)